MIHLWRDPETGQYGLREIARSDGTFGHYGDVSDEVRPDWITDHGTKVILLGNVADEVTTMAPEGFSARDRWINKYLNTRYFRIPDALTISAREGMEAAAKGGKLGYLRHVYGQSYFLSKAKISSNVVELTGAKARWWIVKERAELQTEGPSYETTGHIAALHQNELYEMLTQRAGRARLQEFGIIFGANRVVIYVEPTGGHVTTNTARTRLIVDGEDLPWSEWAAEFRERMPQEIRDLMDEVGAKAPSNDHEKTIRERLKPLMDLYRVSRYRLDPTGGSAVDEDNLTPGGQPSRGGSGDSGGGGRGGSKGGKAGGAYGNFLKNDGSKGKAVHPDVFPTVRWVSVQDTPPSRNHGDIEDRAARYFPEQNLLLINRDFRAFTAWSTVGRASTMDIPALEQSARKQFDCGTSKHWSRPLSASRPSRSPPSGRRKWFARRCQRRRSLLRQCPATTSTTPPNGRSAPGSAGFCKHGGSLQPPALRTTMRVTPGRRRAPCQSRDARNEPFETRWSPYWPTRCSATSIPVGRQRLLRSLSGSG